MLTNNAAAPVSDRVPDLFMSCSVERLDADLRSKLDPEKGLALWGKTGRGKSFTMAAVCNGVGWINWLEFLADIRRHWKLRGDDAHRFDPMAWACRFRQPLYIDDVGEEQDVSTSPQASLGAEQFPLLIAQRHQSKLLTSFTTNLRPEDIEKVYGARTMSRLSEMCVWIHFDGPDRRLSA